MIFFKEGFVFAWTEKEMTEEELRIFRRFAGVLSLTYRRFLDLKEAEAQAHKAQIETALERVRARALAMQQPEELKEVEQVLRHEMGLLGVKESETCGIFIRAENTTKAECWYELINPKDKEKRISDHFELDFNDTSTGWGNSRLSRFNGRACITRTERHSPERMDKSISAAIHLRSKVITEMRYLTSHIICRSSRTEHYV